MGSCCLNNKNLADRLRFLQNAMGPVPSPFDCFLVNRSLKTLKLRMEEHQKNGLIVAKFLEAHPFVEKVQHLLLESHPQLELVKKQQYGHSGMLSFYLKGKVNSLAYWFNPSSILFHFLPFFAIFQLLNFSKNTYWSIHI